MFHLRPGVRPLRVVRRLSAQQSVARRRFSAAQPPKPQPDTRPPAPWGAKPGYKPWQPVPQENPSVDVFQLWAYRMFEGFLVGLVGGAVLMVPLIFYYNKKIVGWHKSTEEYLADVQKYAVEPQRQRVARNAQTAWWYRMDGSNEIDLRDMVRFFKTAKAATFENDSAAQAVLTEQKPWDGKLEAQFREALMEFSEYPNYYKIDPDFSKVGVNEPDEGDEEEEDAFDALLQAAGMGDEDEDDD